MENLSIHNDSLSITRVAMLLNCSPSTIKRWYKWAKTELLSTDDLMLPKYTTDNRGTWYFTLEQVEELQEFRKNLKWGAMAKFNAKHYWSKKGKG